MSLATGKAAFKNAIKALMEQAANNNDPNKATTIDEYADGLANAMETFIKTAQVNVPGTGLVAPPGGGGVTGTSNTGNLT